MYEYVVSTSVKVQLRATQMVRKGVATNDAHPLVLPLLKRNFMGQKSASWTFDWTSSSPPRNGCASFVATPFRTKFSLDPAEDIKFIPSLFLRCIV
jgi:hypothetical protein